METTKQEIKTRVAIRRPPGDNWSPLLFSSDTVVPSLTDILELLYQETGKTQFFMDAREGYVYTVDQEEVEVAPIPEKKWSLYGDDV
jgi:hypothetical protein